MSSSAFLITQTNPTAGRFVPPGDVRGNPTAHFVNHLGVVRLGFCVTIGAFWKSKEMNRCLVMM